MNKINGSSENGTSDPGKLAVEPEKSETLKPAVTSPKPQIKSEKPPTVKPAVVAEKPKIKTEKPNLISEKPLIKSGKPSVGSEKPQIKTEISKLTGKSKPEVKPEKTPEKPEVKPEKTPEKPQEKPTQNLVKSSIFSKMSIKTKPNLKTEKPAKSEKANGKPPIVQLNGSKSKVAGGQKVMFSEGDDKLSELKNVLKSNNNQSRLVIES